MSLAEPNESECYEFAWKIEFDDREGVKEMLEDGFPVDIGLEHLYPDTNALEHAIYGEDYKMACLLLKYGADPHSIPPNIPAETIQHWAQYDVAFEPPIKTLAFNFHFFESSRPQLRNVFVASLLATPPMPTIQEGFKYDEFDTKK